MVAFTIYRLDVYFPAHLLNDTNSETAPFRPLLSSLHSSNFGSTFFSYFQTGFHTPSILHAFTFHHLVHAPNISSHCFDLSLRRVLAVSLGLGSLFIATLIPLLPESSLRSGRLKRGQLRQRNDTGVVVSKGWVGLQYTRRLHERLCRRAFVPCLERGRERVSVCVCVFVCLL